MSTLDMALSRWQKATLDVTLRSKILTESAASEAGAASETGAGADSAGRSFADDFGAHVEVLRQ